MRRISFDLQISRPDEVSVWSGFTRDKVAFPLKEMEADGFTFEERIDEVGVYYQIVRKRVAEIQGK